MRSRSRASTRLPFNHPLYILFSSGTTGVPKCIVHGAGGTLLQHLKEHRLHSDVRPGDRVFYFTTCGWMMWNWLVSGLAAGATLMLFDGSPFHPQPSVLFDYAQQERHHAVRHVGEIHRRAAKGRASSRATRTISRSVRLIASTGSPLAPESFDYVYDAIKPDVHLASISGGTDIVSCFVLGDPTAPVYAARSRRPASAWLSTSVDDDGNPIRRQKGELVCTQAFPIDADRCSGTTPRARNIAPPISSEFPSVWCHGDFAEWTEHGGLIIHGRSDATLNPGGVRIGTAEIYRASRADPRNHGSARHRAGLGWRRAGHPVRPAARRRHARRRSPGRIRTKIRTGASPRHVPARIVQVADIPRTKSGKITELAVRDVVHGREVKNQEALANPEALALFSNLPALQS